MEGNNLVRLDQCPKKKIIKSELKGHCISTNIKNIPDEVEVKELEPNRNI